MRTYTLPHFATKNQIARLLGVDVRSKAIQSLEPVGVLHLGGKEVEVYALPNRK